MMIEVRVDQLLEEQERTLLLVGERDGHQPHDAVAVEEGEGAGDQLWDIRADLPCAEVSAGRRADVNEGEEERQGGIGIARKRLH